MPRARLLVITILSLDAGGLIFAAAYAWLGLYALAACILLSAGVATGALFVLRRWGLRWATHWWGAVSLCVCIGTTAYQGMMASAGAWLGIMLLMLCMVGGIQVGRLWLLPICAVYVSMVAMQVSGELPGDVPFPAEDILPEVLSHLFCFFAAYGIAHSYERFTQLTFEQLTEARDRADDASRAKSEFLAVMSHEIRTPLNGILGLGDLLRQTRLSGEQRHLLEVHRASSEGLMVLINDILDFSKIEAGSMGVERIPLSVPALVDDVVALFQTAAADKGLALRVAVDAPSEWVLGDPVRLRQILCNLVNNAIKFTPSGSVEVSVRARGEWWELSVTDTGIGVPPQRQEELFEAFTQAESSTTRRFGGTGLGLAISRKLAVLMGGTLGVESDGQSGSCFRLVLPLYPATPTGLVRPAPEPAEPDLSGRVLLVEDNAVNQLVGQRLLEGLGLSVDIAEDGEVALRKLASGRYGLVLMDCQMPKMDGYTATRIARERGITVPIVALTADVTVGARSAVQAAGMDDYLCKPINRRRLQQVLQRHLQAA